MEVLIPYPDIGSKLEPMVTKPMIINRLPRKGVKLSIMTAAKAPVCA